MIFLGRMNSRKGTRNRRDLEKEFAYDIYEWKVFVEGIQRWKGFVEGICG